MHREKRRVIPSQPLRKASRRHAPDGAGPGLLRAQRLDHRAPRAVRGFWGAAVPSPAALVAWGSRTSTSTSTSASTRPLTSSTSLSTARLAPISHGSRRTTSSTSRTSPSTACWAGLGRLPAGLQLTTWIWTWMWRPCRARTRPGCTAHAPARAAAERLQPSDHPPPHPPTHPTVCASVRSASGEIRESVVRRHAVCHL